jgi:hypothetical protein
MTTDWDQAHAEYSLAIRSSIAFFEASGTLTRKSAMAALQRFYEVYPNDRPEVTGVVVMYDRCNLQTTMVDLVAIYKDIAAHGLPIDVPLALVVPEWAYGLAKEYCDHQRNSGVIRDAFRCRELAQEWVERQVALLELQRKSRGG